MRGSNGPESGEEAQHFLSIRAPLTAPTTFTVTREADSCVDRVP